MRIRFVLQAFVVATLLAGALPRAVPANGWEWHSIPRAALIAGLKGEDPEAKAYAIRALGFRADTGVVPRLIEIAGSEDETIETRGTAVRALAFIKDRRALAALVTLMRNSAIRQLRGSAA